jgi:Flp pilus assembly protein TadB
MWRGSGWRAVKQAGHVTTHYPARHEPAELGKIVRRIGTEPRRKEKLLLGRAQFSRIKHTTADQQSSPKGKDRGRLRRRIMITVVTVAPVMIMVTVVIMVTIVVAVVVTVVILIFIIIVGRAPFAAGVHKAGQ